MDEPASTAGNEPDEKAAAKLAQVAAELKANESSMQVKVYSPYKVYFDGEAVSVSAASTTGDFDILPRHHNFITLLAPCDLEVRTTNEPTVIPILGGIMHVKANEVTVFLDV